jgi:RIO kinase 1
VSKRPRRRFDDDDFQPADEPNWSTYHHPDTTRGPSPVPSWVITSAAAVDDDLGVLKTGKEAEVALVRRGDGDASAWLAAKRYRDPQHRLFHRDAGYLEGRRVRRSRETRAMATRTDFGRQLIAGQWAAVEFAVLARLWQAGAAVPYPVQLLGTELLLEFIGDADGTAAPRLAQLHPGADEAADLYAQLRRALVQLGEAGYTHGDLSPYNILVDHGRLVLIDLPQAVDLVGNPQGFDFLRRDCRNVCAWFDERGVFADPAELEAEISSTVPGIRR